MRQRTTRAWASIAWAVVLSWYAIEVQKPPGDLTADAPWDVFAAARAYEHIEAISRAPHPMGSREAEYVRETLIQKLEELELGPEIQRADRLNSPVRNIIARLNGQGARGKKALMLCAHYDSVPASPGAGDDASGIAVIIETLRALKAGPTLARCYRAFYRW